jgi:hypothetical protein
VIGQAEPHDAHVLLWDYERARMIAHTATKPTFAR